MKHARHPGIRLDVSIDNQVVDLVAEGFDLAIRFSDALKDSNLTARRLGSLSFGAFAAPTYLARRGRPQRLGDERHDWVLARVLLPRLPVLGKVPIRFVCDDFLVLRDLLREGAGVGLLPSFVAEPHVREGLLEPVELADFEGGPRSAFFLVYPSSGQVPRKVTAFRDFLLEELERSSLR